MLVQPELNMPVARLLERDGTAHGLPSYSKTGELCQKDPVTKPGPQKTKPSQIREKVSSSGTSLLSNARADHQKVLH